VLSIFFFLVGERADQAMSSRVSMVAAASKIAAAGKVAISTAR